MSAPFDIATAQRDVLDARLIAASTALRDFLNQFERGPCNLTPDHVKAMPEFKALKSNCAAAFSALRAFNGHYIKTFKKELRAARMQRRASLRTA